MSSFTKNGRFGNQIFQYFFLQLTKSILNCNTSHPGWIGESIFDIAPANAIGHQAPQIIERDLGFQDGAPKDIIAHLEAIMDHNKIDAIDVAGYFQHHTSHLEEYRNLFLQTFTFKQELLNQLEKALQLCNAINRKIIGIHIRQGDYLQLQDSNVFWYNSIDSVVASVNDILRTSMRQPIIYLASDDLPSVCAAFNERGVPHFTHHNLHFAKALDPMVIDFLMLSRAAAMLISNSTFSYSAAMLNNNAAIYLRPDPQNDKFIPFDPWNSSILLTR